MRSTFPDRLACLGFQRHALARAIGTLFLTALWVLGPTASAHTHVEIVYREGHLHLLYYDFDYGEARPADVLLEVGLPAATPIASLSAYTNLLGAAGATTWILPQTYNPQLLWLGIGNESLRASDFAGPLSLSLLAVEGPGHFALFLSDAFGQPVTLMNSRDGVNTQDVMTVPLGSHIHCNWAFSAPGRYRLTLMVSGTLRAGNTTITSAPTDYFFEVVPPPPPRLALARTPTNDLRLTLEAHPGLNYDLESATTFTHWTVLTNLHATFPGMSYLLSPGPAQSQYFRARLR
jgi:surface-anchored protein